MGTVHSRKGRGPAQADKKMTLGANHPPPTTGYFMLSFKGDRVKVVNADSGELKLLTAIIRRHCQILKEGWDRHLTFSYRLKVAGRHCMIQLVADTLLSLYQAGWEPMTPMDMGLRREHGVQTTICFKRKEGNNLKSEDFGSTYSLLSKMGSSMDSDNLCLCLEIFQSNFLGFHDTTNTVLHELVTTIQRDWSPGIRGVSMGVASVISDYTRDMPAVLPQHPQLRDEKYIQLEGRPWEQGQEDPVATENLQMAIIACLIKEGYKLSMDINMDPSSRVFFFIKDTEEQSGEVRIPNMSGAGLGEKDGLALYRPMIVRSKSSFFRTCQGRTNSVRRAVRASLRRKAVAGGVPGRAGGVMAYKPATDSPAWWQQSSTDISSDQEDDSSP